MEVKTDGVGQPYIEVGKTRYTLVNNKKNIRMRQLRDDGKGLKRHGPEFNSDDIPEVISALKNLYKMT